MGEILMARVDLPGGHAAELREVEDVRRGDVRYVAAAADKDMTMSAEGQRMEAAGAMLGTATMQDAVIHRFVISWTLTRADVGEQADGPLPVTLDVVQDLPLRFYKPLAAATLPALQEIMGAGQTLNGQAPDPLSVGPSSPPASTD